VNKDFEFEFVDGNKEYESGREAPKTALSRGFMHRGDRGSLAVALFRVHNTSHYEDARNVRERADPAAMRAIAEALVREVREGRWKTRHEFRRRLLAPDRELLRALEGYGVRV
jgi:hypothetical protein